ncbi:exportin-5 [Anabrus simplex]|uniref:exportin-5 n=1 Tax=Anabrus simplex TaxID=316456 RepID=UPI0034DD0AC5
MEVEGLAEMARKLAGAVELTMDPLVPQQQRMEAYTAVERFKDTSSVCAQCGFFLAQCPKESPFVRHFGLQLVEHCVKYRWNQMSQQEKIFIKDNVMKLLGRGMEPELLEHAHIKDAMSRVVVEMIKREWPQHWPDLLKELSNTCKLGESQTELVLMVFLRLVEDVALLQTLESNQRRKDIHQALTLNMSEIFTFFMQLMEDHGGSCRTYVEMQQLNYAYPHMRVVKVALQTVAAFVEWVSITHIMAQDGRLLQILCVLLCDREFRIPAAECLLQIVNRKGRVEERKPLLVLFHKDAVECMQQAVGTMNVTSTLTQPENYLFLKKLCQVLTGLGMQLCTLWGKDDTSICRPIHFSLYLSTIVELIGHESLTIVHSINSVWMAFFKHDLISKDEVFLEYVPYWVKTTFHKVIKVSYPSSRNFKDLGSVTEGYACQDYDSEEEFSAFFHRCRTDLLDTYRQAMLVAPLETFNFVAERLHSYLIRSFPTATSQQLNPPTLLEWEGLSQVLDCVLSRILQCSVRPNVETGLQLLEQCLQYEPPDPLLLSILLSCISALFVFLTMVRPDDEKGTSLLPRVLDKIFATLIFTLPGQTKDSRSRVVKNVRRHAASLMVKISQKYPLLLLPLFNQIYRTVQGLNCDPGQLSKLERVTLQEALLLISNHFCDYQQQSKFVEEVIGSGAGQWLEMGSEAFKGPKEFMAFVGLDRPPVEPSSDDVNGQNRSHIHFCVNLFMAVVKRCTWPDDPDRAARGGFCVTHTEEGNPVIRNPAAPHIIPLLPSLLALLRVFNALWTPEALALLSEGYQAAHAMLVVDRTNLLGIGSPPGEIMDVTRPRAQTPLDRMQHFLTMVHDSCYHILGNCGTSLRRDFYSLPGLAQSIINSLFSNLEMIPDYRLRPMVRVFLKPFICSCPPAYYESVLLPVLGSFCPFMFQRLVSKWQYISQLYETGSIEDENSDTQEVVEDMLNRTVTREYLDVLKFALVGSSSDAATTIGMEIMEQDDRCEPPRLNSMLQSELSELGTLILRNEATRQSVVLCVIRALSWNDTIASLKATYLAAPIVRLMANDGCLTQSSANHIMTSVLQGLQLHGQHEANNGSLLTLGVQVYEILRPNFQGLGELMMQIPGCSAAELKKLDEKIFSHNQKGNKAEKAKKEIFKRITTQLIGRSVGQLFRKEVHIADLPRLEVPRRSKQLALDEQLQETETLCALFSPSPNNTT